MKKKIAMLMIVGVTIVGTLGCASIERGMKEFESNTKGLARIVKVYSMDGTEIAKYESSNMIVKDGEGGTIQIDFDGKRVTFANTQVIIEEKGVEN